MMGMGLGQCNGMGLPVGHAMGTVWWACDGDSPKGMIRTAMGYSSGKHRATRRQLMTREWFKSRQRGKTHGRDGPQALSGVLLRQPWAITPGICQTPLHRWEHVLTSAPCPLLRVSEMWPTPGGTEKLLNVRVQAPSRATHPIPAQALEEKCHWQTSHLLLLREFQFGTRKENSKWSLL